MLLLAGAPGSGKSTFSQRLLAGAPMPWQHINQDSIKGGKPGSRQDCIHAAARALCSGVNCVIDRCHTSPEQRADFVELARSKGSAVHCVVLALPLSTCHERVSARDDHPTLQGPGAKGLVTKMHRELSERHGLPDAAAEGLASVCVCSSIAAWDAALAAWLKYPQEGWDAGLAGMAPAPGTVGPQPASPSGKQGKGAKQQKEKEKPGEGKQRSFMQAWLKPKVGAAAAAAGAAAGPAPPQSAAAGAQGQGEARASGAERKGSEGNHGVEVGVKRPRSEAANGAGAGLDGEEGMAAKKERVEGMGDVAGASATAGQAAPVPAATPADAPAQDTKSDSGAVGAPALETQAAAGASALEAAASVADAAAVIQPGGTVAGVATGGPEPAHAVAGPAAAAAPADPAGAGASGIAAASFAGGSGPAPAVGPSGAAGGAGDAGTSGDALAGASTGAPAAGPSAASGAGGAGGSGAAPATGPSGTGGAGGAGTSGGGGFVMGPHPGHGPLQALQRFARDPAGSASQMDEAWWDDRVLRLLDKYPKSIHHGLVVARDPKLLSVTDLRPQHLPLLEHMREVGVAWAQTKQTPAPFRMGFHQVPSLPQLHMHVMSQDMDSPGLKNKKHWNSFTSPYFMPLDTAVQKLRESGAVTVDKAVMERLLKRDLVCHHVGCGRMFRTMPELKTHIKACRLPFPV